MDNLDLRGYQQKLVDEILANIAQGNNSIVMSLPTGGGKTVIALALSIEMIKRHYHPVFITERIVLVGQTERMFVKHGMSCQILQGENTILRADPDCTVGTIQTISSYSEKAALGNRTNPDRKSVV